MVKKIKPLLNKDILDAYLNLAIAFRKSKKYADAIEILTKAISLEPKSPEAHQALGLTFIEAGQYSDAIISLRKAISLTSKNKHEALSSSYFSLGSALQSLDKHEQAIRAFNRSIELGNEKVELFDFIGDSLIQINKIEEAHKAFDRAIAIDPRYAEAYRKKARTFRNSGQYKEALIWFDRAIELRDNFAQAIAGKAETLRLMNCYSEAISLFQKSLAIDPADSFSLVHEIDACLSLKLYKEAEQLADTLIEIEKNTAAILVKAEVFISNEDLEKSIELLNQIIEAEPENTSAYFLKAQVFIKMQQWKDALRSLEVCQNINKKNKNKYGEAIVWRQIGHVNRDMNQTKDAQISYEKALKLFDKVNEELMSAWTTSDIGWLYWDQGDWTLAISLHQKALSVFEKLDLSSERAWMLNNIAKAYKGAGLLEDAYQALVASSDILQRAGNFEEAFNRLYDIGVVESERKHWSQAIEYYQKALLGFEELKKPNLQAKVWLSIGKAHQGARSWDEAESAFRKSQDLYRSINESQGEAWLYNELSLLEIYRKHWDAALEYIGCGRIAIEALKDQDAQASFWFNIGTAYQEVKRWEEAKNAFKKCQEVLIISNNKVGEISIINSLGLLEAEQEHWMKALDYYQQVLTKLEDVEDSKFKDILATVMYNKGRALKGAKLWQDAENALCKSQDLFREKGDRRGEAWRFNDLGLLEADQEHWGAAIEYYRQAVSAFEEINNKDALATVWLNIANAQRRSWHWKDSEYSYNQSLDLFKMLDNESGQIEIIYRLGQLEEAQEHWLKSLEYYQESLENINEVDQPIIQARFWKRTGWAYMGIKNWEKAEEALRKALSFYKEMGMKENEAWTLNDLGQLETEQENWDEALDYYNQAIEMFKEVNSKDGQAWIMHYTGLTYLDAKRWSDAEKSFKNSIELFKGLNDQGNVAWQINALGVLAKAQRHWDKALDNYQKAIDIFRELKQPFNIACILTNIGRLKIEFKEYDYAKNSIYKALKIFEELQIIEQQSICYKLLGTLAMESDGILSSKEYLLKSVEFNSENWESRIQLSNVLIGSGDPTSVEIFSLPCLNENPEWRLLAQISISVAKLYIGKLAEANEGIYKSKTLISEGLSTHTIPEYYREAANVIIDALEGRVKESLDRLHNLDEDPATAENRDAYRYAKLLLFLLSKCPHSLTGHPNLGDFGTFYSL